jgi:hypothetical protein
MITGGYVGQPGPRSTSSFFFFFFFFFFELYPSASFGNWVTRS